VTPEATIAVSHKTGFPACKAARPAGQNPGEAATSATRSTIPQAWIMRTTTVASSGSSPPRSASPRMIANERR
jgi:hypothetical protein